MLFVTCKKCGRPLSEGAVARGDAIEDGSGMICTSCHESSPVIETAPSSALSQYDNAVWSCESCGIPVNALDMIEGRANKVDGRIVCGRCVKAKSARSEPVLVSELKKEEPAVSGLISGKARAFANSGRTLNKAVATPRKSLSAKEDYVAKAEADSKKPMLPVVLFAIILPMFAVSLYFAVMSQQQLNDMRQQNATADGLDDGADRPPQARPIPELLVPDKLDQKDETKPIVTAPEYTPTREKPLTEKTVAGLSDIETELAGPVNSLLESDELADVWEGLIQAGSQRLIASRPWVRRLLADQDDSTRALSAHVCGLLSDDKALPLLDSMAKKDPSSDVRMQARKAKARLIGNATREPSDFSTNGLERLLRDLKKELDRRKGND